MSKKEKRHVLLPKLKEKEVNLHGLDLTVLEVALMAAQQQSRIVRRRTKINRKPRVIAMMAPNLLQNNSLVKIVLFLTPTICLSMVIFASSAKFLKH